MQIPKDQVCVLIPTLNEAPTIADLVHEFRSLGYPHVLVIDGHSTDGTVALAEEAGAEVIVQTGRGKGTAVAEALAVIPEPFILMLDGDGTYAPADAEAMLNPLAQGYDHVIGNRLVERNEGAFSRLNLIGNRFINNLFKMAHSHYLFDILSGYRAFSRESILAIYLKEAGFAVETEMSAGVVKKEQKVAVVPVQYRTRPGTGTKLNPFHDGLKIISTMYRLARMNNPMFYFGLIGLCCIVIGLVTGLYIVLEWLSGVDHLPLTILAVFLIMVGFEIFMFGVLSDMLLAYHREMMREIQCIRLEYRHEVHQDLNRSINGINGTRDAARSQECGLCVVISERGDFK
ncbi:MAG: S-layer glycoprotein N-glycosyltransferase AglJ [Methanomicrobiales archaeon]|jgi:dolichol-phosphate mannosyltransferase|nr:S-layer glycoprotein N-glycosyltransferase AglJ [Methanomicrobiales archaeon]